MLEEQLMMGLISQ
jgi:hypothetical protein